MLSLLAGTVPAALRRSLTAFSSAMLLSHPPDVPLLPAAALGRFETGLIEGRSDGLRGFRPTDARNPQLKFELVVPLKRIHLSDLKRLLAGRSEVGVARVSPLCPRAFLGGGRRALALLILDDFELKRVANFLLTGVHAEVRADEPAAL
jgi:hypothetical protein